MKKMTTNEIFILTNRQHGIDAERLKSIQLLKKNLKLECARVKKEIKKGSLLYENHLVQFLDNQSGFTTKNTPSIAWMEIFFKILQLKLYAFKTVNSISETWPTIELKSNRQKNDYISIVKRFFLYQVFL